jgi:hypothetical protein
MGMVREKGPTASIRIKCGAARIIHGRMLAII